MPGVAPERIEITSEPGALIVRGVRPLAFAGACRRAIRRLEIPYGVFERRIALPPGRLEASLPELRERLPGAAPAQAGLTGP